MVPRIITAILGIPLLFFIIAFGESWHFVLMMALITGMALWEFFTMVFPGRPVERLSGVALGLLVFFGTVCSAASFYGTLAALVLIGAVSIYLVKEEQPVRGRRLAWGLLGLLYIGYLFPHWVLLYEVPAGQNWVFFVLLVIMSGDSAGYFVGTRFGRKKIYPRLSPHKTLEGTLAVVVAGALIGLWGSRFLLPGLAPWEAFWFSLFLSVLGQGGDLFESWIKRSFSVKDSGAWLPGHGGFLDRMDSLIFPTLVTTHYVRLFHS